MKKSRNFAKKKVELKELINKIAPEKLERAIFILEYMVAASTEEAKLLVEYSKSEEVTLDMIVEWVKNKQAEVAL